MMQYLQNKTKITYPTTVSFCYLRNTVMYCCARCVINGEKDLNSKFTVFETVTLARSSLS